MFNLMSIMKNKCDKLFNHINNVKKIRNLEKYKIYNSRIPRHGNTTKAIIQIHTGKSQVPKYSQYCIDQIRLLDSMIPIYFICSKKCKVPYTTASCKFLCEDDLIISQEHLDFLKQVNDKYISSFFQVTIERFFILYDVMLTLGLENILHLENDNLLYKNATNLIEQLSNYYTQIAIPRASKQMGVASIMFVPHQEALKDFLTYILNVSEDVYFNDMALLPAYIDAGRGSTLPSLTRNYVEENGLHTVNNIFAKKDECVTDYFNYSDELNGIFDCACLGQYMDGCDAAFHPEKRSGFVNEDSYLDPRKIKMKWIKDECGLVRPYYCIENGNKYLIHNLHIHSKRLKLFMSDSNNN